VLSAVLCCALLCVQMELPWLDSNGQRWRRVLDIDLNAVAEGTRLALMYMRAPRAHFTSPTAATPLELKCGGAESATVPLAERAADNVCGGSGSVINVASMAGILPQQHAPLYTAAKFGVVGLSRACTGFQRPHGIRVNAICPSFTDTNMYRNSVAIDAKAKAGAEKIGVMPVALVVQVSRVPSAMRTGLTGWCD
jgi:NAD(P)-dependent dehydrogenase (short-subunit alcohol dehydrogenase family)